MKKRPSRLTGGYRPEPNPHVGLGRLLGAFFVACGLIVLGSACFLVWSVVSVRGAQL